MGIPVDRLCIADFSFELPPEKIALHPVSPRDHSRLLVVEKNSISPHQFSSLPTLLPEDSLVIFNNTRVVQARLLFQKPTGSLIEIFCLEPAEPGKEMSGAMDQQSEAQWKCLVGNAGAWTNGLVLEKCTVLNPERPGEQESLILYAELLEKQPNEFLVRFRWTPAHIHFGELLHECGSIPLPPYIRRKPVREDVERYQTVYARHEGSVAAPTAGLHFTAQTLDDLEAHKISKDFITLHVGAGTFLPVKAEKMKDHQMHSEYIGIPRQLVVNLLRFTQKKKQVAQNSKEHEGYGSITAVGTTSLRSLESIYWIGHLLLRDPEIKLEELYIPQWYPYEQKTSPEVADCLQAVLDRMATDKSELLFTKTALLIAPGYPFKLVDQLVTNFHQPKSTLLLLVAAFAGEKWKSAYAYALEHDFRFLSYGDACLFFRN